MKLKRRDPHSPEVRRDVIAFFESMTPEELHAFVTYRTPGVEETDMTGMYGLYKDEKREPETEKAKASA